jgi:hypothetical protein
VPAALSMMLIITSQVKLNGQVPDIIMLIQCDKKIIKFLTGTSKTLPDYRPDASAVNPMTAGFCKFGVRR